MVTPLKIAFPKSREHLWDSSPTGAPVDIFPLRGDKLELQLRTSTLRLAIQHCHESRSNCCFLLGSAQSNSAEELVLTVDRFDPGVTTQSLDLGPTAVLDGDIPVRTSIPQNESEWKEHLPYNERELDEAVETLSLLLSQSQQVSLDMFLTLQLSLLPLPSSGQVRIRAGAVLSGGHLQMCPVPPIPLLPTALARNLTGPNPIYQVQQRTRGGYLTMDESRRLLLLLDSDPKAPNFPVVGVWVGGAASVQHPAVWASCMQYVRTDLLRDKAVAPARGFLLLLYSHESEPAFFQCSCQEQDLLFSFLSSESVFSLTQEETTSCQLVALSPPLLSTQLRNRALSGLSKGQLSLFEDPVPHSPQPTPVATLAFTKEDSLLNLSIIDSVPSNSSNNRRPDTNYTSFCQQVTSSMLLPGPAPDLQLSPLSPPPPTRDVTPCPLSAEDTAALLREQQLKIEALQAQVEMLLQHHNSPPPLPISSISVASSLDQTLPSINPTDVPSFVSHETTRSSTIREITPQLQALSPPEPELTISSSLCSASLGEVLAPDHFGRETQHTRGDSLISGLESEREEDPVRLFTSEFIRQNETHRELTARHLSDTPDIPPPPPIPVDTSSLTDSSLSSIYIPRIQYHALPREDSFVSLRDPSDQLTLKYLEGRSILLDPSVQQLSFIQQGAGRQGARERETGINAISAMSIDTRAYLERHNLMSERREGTVDVFTQPERLHY